MKRGLLTSLRAQEAADYFAGAPDAAEVSDHID
jgi:hypothetical protein